MASDSFQFVETQHFGRKPARALTSRSGSDAPVELGQIAVETLRVLEVGRVPGAVVPAALLHASLGRHLFANCSGDAALAAFERAVVLVPEQPPSRERAETLAALGNGLMLAWRHDESAAISEQALALARSVGAQPGGPRALTVLGTDRAYVGRGDEGLAQLSETLRLAEERADPVALQRAYVNLTDALMMLGRPRESARLAEAALPACRRYGLDDSTLVANWIELLVARGEWDKADEVSAAALRHHRQLSAHATHSSR